MRQSYKKLIVIVIGTIIVGLSFLLIILSRHIPFLIKDKSSVSTHNDQQLSSEGLTGTVVSRSFSAAGSVPTSNENQVNSEKEMKNSIPDLTLLDRKNLYATLETTFVNLTPRDTITFTFDLFDVANCPDCMQLIQDQLFSDSLTTNQIQQIAAWLSQGNHPELALMLADTANKLMGQNGLNEGSAALIPTIANFNSVETAQQFTDYLLLNMQIPFELQDAIIKSINNTVEAQEVAITIFDRFMDTNDQSERETLLSIGQPESLVKIAEMALAQGDEDLYERATDYLSCAPSQFTFNALLELVQSQIDDASRQDDIIEVAKKWAYHQLSGSRLDFVEERLMSQTLSDQDMLVARNLLEHAEDQARSSEIIAKYW